jgi:DNA-binding IclR family transcriptional regulator
VLYLASRESRSSHLVVSRIGRRLPAHVTALGQALLAELTDEEVDAVLPDDLEVLTQNTIADRPRLYQALDEVRSRSWAFEREQGTIGVACIATAVAYRIPATDAISCSMPAAMATGAELERVAEVVVRHSGRLAAMLRREGIR